MPIRILCPGKTKEAWIKAGIAEYQKRLTANWSTRIVELGDVSLKTAGTPEKVKAKEAEIILKAITEGEYVIALDEQGKSLDSLVFAAFLQQSLENGKIAFIIGGVYGLDGSVLKRADRCVSFSAFTFTHQLIRLVLMEQIYRAFTIGSGKAYHY